ncbi:MAG TPA: hypothetical protein VFE62_29175 [Gemmataceae bacterium]|nr:hypothetical protein [Gemmataceae bacterium]
MAKVPRKGVVSVTFDLRMIGGDFNLTARDNANVFYSTTVAPASTDPDWVALLLRRIANAGGSPGWKFDATFDTETGTGTIDG